MSTGNVVLGALAGLAVGAALGILFAPDKGTSTRKKICKKGEQVVDDLGDKFNEFIDGITEKFENLKEEAMHMAEEGKQKMHEAEAKATKATK